MPVKKYVFSRREQWSSTLKLNFVHWSNGSFGRARLTFEAKNFDWCSTQEYHAIWNTVPQHWNLLQCYFGELFQTIQLRLKSAPFKRVVKQKRLGHALLAQECLLSDLTQASGFVWGTSWPTQMRRAKVTKTHNLSNTTCLPWTPAPQVLLHCAASRRVWKEKQTTPKALWDTSIWSIYLHCLFADLFGPGQLQWIVRRYRPTLHKDFSWDIPLSSTLSKIRKAIRHREEVVIQIRSPLSRYRGWVASLYYRLGPERHKEMHLMPPGTSGANDIAMTVSVLSGATLPERWFVTCLAFVCLDLENNPAPQSDLDAPSQAVWPSVYLYRKKITCTILQRISVQWPKIHTFEGCVMHSNCLRLRDVAWILHEYLGSLTPLSPILVAGFEVGYIGLLSCKFTHFTSVPANCKLTPARNKFSWNAKMQFSTVGSSRRVWCVLASSSLHWYVLTSFFFPGGEKDVKKSLSNWRIPVRGQILFLTCMRQKIYLMDELYSPPCVEML